MRRIDESGWRIFKIIIWWIVLKYHIILVVLIEDNIRFSQGENNSETMNVPKRTKKDYKDKKQWAVVSSPLVNHQKLLLFILSRIMLAGFEQFRDIPRTFWLNKWNQIKFTPKNWYFCETLNNIKPREGSVWGKILKPIFRTPH